MMLEEMKGLKVCIANAFGAAGAEPVTRLSDPCTQPYTESHDHFDQRRNRTGRTPEHAQKELLARNGARSRIGDHQHVAAGHHVVA